MTSNSAENLALVKHHGELRLAVLGALSALSILGTHPMYSTVLLRVIEPGKARRLRSGSAAAHFADEEPGKAR